MRALTLVVALGLAAGCATTSTLKLAQRAEAAEDFDLAVVQYSRLVREAPTAMRPALGSNVHGCVPRNTTWAGGGGSSRRDSLTMRWRNCSWQMS